MGLHYYICKNQDCKSYNRNFSLVFEYSPGAPYSTAEQCPFCHCDNILRDFVREHNNRYRFEKNLLELSK
jgi:hypothetical protein